MSRSFDQLWMKRAKTLTQALIISGTMNIGLLGTFVYFVLSERHAAISFDLPHHDKEAIVYETNEEILRSYSSLSFTELMLLLENKDLVEEGFFRRDLALACLVAFHHFHIDQALGGAATQKRRIFFRNKDATQALDVFVFPGLADDQYEGILSYAKTEKWPFTSKGLFFEVKRSKVEIDASLLEAFYTTPEFFSVYTFFQKVGLPIEKQSLIALLVDGDWETVTQFCDEQRLLQDFSEDKRRSFLLKYFTHYESKMAAVLLSMQDLEFVAKRLDDSSLLTFIALLSDQPPLMQKMAKDLLISPRSDVVRKAAASLLYASLSEKLPEPYDYLVAVEKFCPEAIQKVPQAMQKAKALSQSGLETVALELSKDKGVGSKGRVHTIEAGDSLWKISRKYKVSIEQLKKTNHLETEKLKVGKQLQIPDAKT